jgi:spermidine synthase
MLWLDDIECSYVDLADPTHIEFGYIRRFADAVDLIAPAGKPIRATHLGGGGFTLPRYVAATRPGSRQIVYEYDEGLIELARAELGLTTSPQLRVKVGDARTRLARRSPDSADIVVGDAFVGRHIPEHLATVEFVELVHSVLRPGGIYTLNVIDAPPLSFARAEGAVLLGVFTHVMLCTDADVLRGKESGNLVYLASDAPLPFDEISRRAARGQLPERVVDRAGVERFVGTARPLHDSPTADPAA